MVPTLSSFTWFGPNDSSSLCALAIFLAPPLHSSSPFLCGDTARGGVSSAESQLRKNRISFGVVNLQYYNWPLGGKGTFINIDAASPDPSAKMDL